MAPPPSTPTPGPATRRPPLNNASVFALVLSLLGLAMLVPIAGSIIGIVFGNRAMDQVEQTGERGGGMAQAAVIFGYFGLVTVGLVLAVFVVIVVLAKHANP